MSDRIVVMRAGQIEQIGTPREIYRHPKNRFVAEFIGDTNLFVATVDRIDDTLAFATTADGVKLTLRATGRTLGEVVTAAVRPADFTISDHGITGKVERAVYLGSDLYLFVQPDQGGPTIRVNVRDGAGVEAGAAVALTYDPARIHVLEEN